MAELTHPKPSGPMVEFYLSANSQYEKGESIPVSINGHKYSVRVGQKNTLPQEVVQVLKDSRSRTEKVKTSSYDPEQGGIPRSDREFYNPARDYVYLSEFDVEEIKTH